MAKGGITIQGLPELQAKLNLVTIRARAAAAAAIVQEVEAVEADARAGAPVDSGELQAGIEGTASALDGEVRTRARHSVFVEHGTYKDPAQPFMAPAAERSRLRFPARAGALIKAAVEGLGK